MESHDELRRLSDVLWAERRLLELLLFKLEEEQLLLTSGRSRWLGHAAREVAKVLDEIRSAEVGRAAEADAAAVALGLEPGTPLGELALAAPAPWDELLLSHRDAFAQLTSEISELADGNRELLAVSHRATQETLLALRRESETYDDTGHAASIDRSGQIFDASL
ncbi:flagellar export chaperone FlgN [Xylanimonas oleitrophica]|uniref:flagellar export chaperone FlgN n=1 Tax=Xylanimonas oleitrophica TaxID=2607479 RepID=UPI001FE6D256|nr:flagellar export chaperone FlgN [Xylanimonas oleitrophica]